jgi:hypothetical protein
MAFSSFGGAGGRTRDVIFRLRVETGEFIGPLGAALKQGDFGLRKMTSTMQMTERQSLELRVAQDKLARSIDKYGQESAQALRATERLAKVEERLEREMRGVERQTNRTTNAMTHQNRTFGRTVRGAIAGSGVFRGLGRAMAFASAGFLGATGFVYGSRLAVAAARDLHEQITKTQEVFGSFAPQVEEFARGSLALSTRQALEFSSTLGALLGPLGIVGKESAQTSTELTQLGVDLASFYNTDVQDALDAIQSALVGQVRPLRRYGAEVSAAREKLVAMEMTGKKTASELTRQERLYARLEIIFRDTEVAQGDFLRTSSGLANQQRTLSSNIEDVAAALGDTLIPAVTGVVAEINDWLSKDENRKKLQEQVNTLVKDGGRILSDFAGVLKFVKRQVGPLVDELGGFSRLLEAFIAFKFAKMAASAALGFAGIIASSSAARTKVVVDAAAMDAALTTATRPRTIVVTTVGGGGAVGTAGRVGRAAALGVLTLGGLAVFESASINAQARAREKQKFLALTKAEQAALLDTLTPEQAAFVLDAFGIKRDPREEVASSGSQGPRGRPGSSLGAAKAAAAGRDAGLEEQTRKERREKVLARISNLEIEAIQVQRDETKKNDLDVARRTAAAYKDLIAASKGNAEEVKDARRQYEQALNDVYRIEQDIADEAERTAEERARERKRIAAERAAKAKERARQYRDTLETRELGLEDAVENAQNVKQYRKRQRALIEFLKARVKDDDLTKRERAQYQKKLTDARAELAKGTIAFQEQVIKTAIENANATIDTEADNIKAEKRAIAFYERLAKRAGQTTKEINHWLQEAAKHRKALAQALKKEKDEEKGRTSSDLVLDFLNTRADFFSSFGSNVFTQTGTGGNTVRDPGSRGTTVVVNQNFNAPTSDRMREARYAKNAALLFMDG